MRKSIRTALLAGFLLSSATVLATPPKQKNPPSPCSKPPELVSKRPLPKEEQEEAKRIRAQGSVAIVISEDGDVVEAKAIHANSNEAAKILIDIVEGFKFKSRPGCGPFKTNFNFTLAE
ncbi:MAG: hypothetical protein ACLQVM_16055 [Terriglobia bacterium]